MPELPEVQTVVNDLKAAGLCGKTISGVDVFWPRTVDSLSPEEFCRRLIGRTVQTIWRRAKYIVIDFEREQHLLIHLRMSGRLHLLSAEEPRARHEHVILSFGDEWQLRFHDTRKFGRMYLVEDPQTVLGHLGPEPFDSALTAPLFTERLHGRTRLLKPLLLDQTFLAGLGNIYTDEALWEARLHPCRRSSSLSRDESHRLLQAIRLVLRQGLQNFGTTLGDGKANFSSVAQRQGQNRERLHVFRRTGLPCPRCQTPVERLIVGQRSTHICPICQVV